MFHNIKTYTGYTLLFGMKFSPFFSEKIQYIKIENKPSRL